MITIFKNIIKFITDPKNTRMLLFALIVILILLLLRQCNKTSNAKLQIEQAISEITRVNNNADALNDTIIKYNVDANTWRSEKLGYEISINELSTKYSNLLGDFKLEKNKPPRVVIKTEYEIKEIIKNVNVFVEIDSLGKNNLTFIDSVKYDSTNYRNISGKIPYELIYSSLDSSYHLEPHKANIDLEIGMNLNLGLFKDKKTKKINIIADTDYPGVTFTSLEGASILEDKKNKKLLRQLRKNWALGVNIGYGIVVNPSSGIINRGVYLGIGVSYSPKFLQW